MWKLTLKPAVGRHLNSRSTPPFIEEYNEMWQREPDKASWPWVKMDFYFVCFLCQCFGWYLLHETALLKKLVWYTWSELPLFFSLKLKMRSITFDQYLFSWFITSNVCSVLSRSCRTCRETLQHNVLLDQWEMTVSTHTRLINYNYTISSHSHPHVSKNSN